MVWRPGVVSHADKVFNEPGELVDETVRGQLRDYLGGFVGFIQAGVPILIGSCQGECKEESGSFSEFAFGPYGSAMS
jgi:hypothetical protein